MKIARCFALYIILTSFCYKSIAQTFNRRDFYTVMSSGDAKAVEEQISLLKNTVIDGKPAFEGALLMKKAGLATGGGRKLSLFKDGHRKLETAIKENDSNAEYRFLRLMIQEHAPKMLGYKEDLKKDSAYIRQSYKKLPAEVQEAIINYSKTSKILRSDDL